MKFCNNVSLRFTLLVAIALITTGCGSKTPEQLEAIQQYQETRHKYFMECLSKVVTNETADVSVKVDTEKDNNYVDSCSDHAYYTTYSSMPRRFSL